MVAPTLVKITRYDPGPTGDTQTPFVGKAGFKPSLIRHIEGETPPDYVVTDKRFFVTFGEALGANPATPGVAWVYLEPTTTGFYANAWGWEISFFRPGQADPCVQTLTYQVPEAGEGEYVDFGDLVVIDPGTGLPVQQPVWIVTNNADFVADMEAAPVGAFVWNIDTDDVFRKTGT